MGLYKLSFLYYCWRNANVADRTPLAGLYKRSLPPRSTSVNECSFLVVDCEMTGLNPKEHALLSIGWVRIENMQINYASRRHILVHATKDVGDSYMIHGLCDRKIAGAASPSKAISLLAQQAENNVLVFHHATLDRAFLQNSAMESFACPIVFPYVDTMEIEQQRMARQSKTGSLQLKLCRDRYNLPAAFQHNAMYDAIATAELFLAQCRYMGSGKSLKLGDLNPHIS